jgi:hypothetical protein
MVAYWSFHALLLALVALWWQSFMQREGSTAVAFLTLVGVGVLITAFFGLLIADVVALIEVIFAERSFGAFAIIIALLLARFMWRLFREPPTMLPEGNAGEPPTWRDVLASVAMIPIGLAGLLTMYATLMVTWLLAELVLRYAVFGRDPASLNWWRPIERAGWYFTNWEMLAFLGVTMVIWIVLEKLLVRPAKSGSKVPD